MGKISLSDRIRYTFDNTISAGPVGLVFWLAVLSGLLILAISLIVFLSGTLPDLGFVEIVWLSLMRTLDPGTMGADQGHWTFLMSMLGVTLGGIFIISTLIGLITSSIDEKLIELRKGRSKVVEQDHIVILGWSEQVFPILADLMEANENRPGTAIVVMGKKDKVEMEDEIREKVGASGPTRLVCRTGDPIDITDLRMVSLGMARAIIVLSPQSDDPDAEVIKTLLAITNDPERTERRYHIVAQIKNPRTLEVARLIGAGEVELVLADDVIARITAQTCRQTGLSLVYSELLDFAGHEIYFHREPSLVGKTFAEALTGFEHAAVIGLASASKGPRLNPPMDTRIDDKDQLILIAEDDDPHHFRRSDSVEVEEAAIVQHSFAAHAPERILILGWNRRASRIIRELDHYVAPGSVVDVVANHQPAADVIAAECTDLRSLAARFRLGDTTDRSLLDGLEVESYDHVVILCYSERLSVQQADARTLTTLLHLRDLAERSGHHFSIVSEMLDVRNRELAEVARPDDFIVSEKLVSLLLSQIAENKALNLVFEDLFNPAGSEIYLKPIEAYARLGEPLSFYTLIEAARRRGEVAFGYRLASLAEDAASSYGVVVNPLKSEPIALGPEDRLIVLAEN